MKRYAYKQLLEWKLSANKKPLMLYGARQVGKTYILKEFGRREYDNCVYINCFQNEIVEQLFSGDTDVHRIVLGLSAISQQNIEEGKTLVILDEIQEIPRAVSMLKYFCEDMPGLDIAVAGSLLGVMNLRNESFPVGKVDILHLYPMTFQEVLDAMGQETLSDILNKRDVEMWNVLAPKYTEYLRQYYFTGGMPEAVKCFIDTRDLEKVREIQKSILAGYEADMAKHSGSDAQRIRMVWDSIPSQLARENKKFIYGAIRKGARAKDFEIAIQWLVDAGLVIKTNRLNGIGLPLRFYVDPNAFKLYMLDIGLLGALSSTPASQILISDNVFAEYKGAFTENYVVQQLNTQFCNDVFYYSKENSTLEVDFIIQKDDRIIPIEVKAEENVKSKSLNSFIKNESGDLHLKGLRFSMKGYVDQDWMENYPLYAVMAAVK